jgi:hypothetical protein
MGAPDSLPFSASDEEGDGYDHGAADHSQGDEHEICHGADYLPFGVARTSTFCSKRLSLEIPVKTAIYLNPWRN